MKILLLVAGSRAGAEFFQSLLDGSNEVSQFPGWLQYEKNLKKILNLKNKDEIVDLFIENYDFYFDSSNSSHERHNQLGRTKDQSYFVDKKEFKKNFLLLIKDQPLNSFNVFKFLHLAYTKTTMGTIENVKVLLANIHLVKYCQEFVNDHENEEVEILHTIRNPLSAIGSPVNNWLKYKKGRLFKPSSFIYHFDLVLNGINDLIKLRKRLRIIQLEKLHKKNKHIMEEFCKIYNLNYINSMQESTFMGKLWWGDAVSGKDLNGVNKDFKISFPEKLFFERDIRLIEILSKNIINQYNYNFTRDQKNVIFYYFPMKIELLIWLNSLKNLKIFDFLSAPYYWFKRVRVSNNYKNSKIDFPYSLGSKFNFK